MKLENLKLPLQPNEIEWRVQSKANGKTVVVPYIQNRAVMNRLDSVCGQDGWKNIYRQWRGKGVLCGISIFIVQTGWVTKWDGADETAIEATKGGLSDSMKRAAVQWGMGRDLYDYPRIMIEGEHKFIPESIKQRLVEMTKAYIDGKIDREFYLLKP